MEVELVKVAGQNPADVLLDTKFCEIRDDLLPWRWKRNVSPGWCVYSLLQAATRSQVFIEW